MPSLCLRPAPQLDPLDPRVRLAADLYNRGVTRGLSPPNDEEVVLDSRSVPLPFGELVLDLGSGSILLERLPVQTLHPGR